MRAQADPPAEQRVDVGQPLLRLAPQLRRVAVGVLGAECVRGPRQRVKHRRVDLRSAQPPDQICGLSHVDGGSDGCQHCGAVARGAVGRHERGQGAVSAEYLIEAPGDPLGGPLLPVDEAGDICRVAGHLAGHSEAAEPAFGHERAQPFGELHPRTPIAIDSIDGALTTPPVRLPQ